MNRLSILAALALSLSLAPLVNAHAADPKGLQVEQRPVADWKPPVVASTLKPIVWMDRSNLVYREGELAQAFVRVNEDAYVVVIDIDAAGSKTIIFPNQYSQDNFLPANQTLGLGTESSKFQLRARPPYGGNLLKVVASKEPIDWWSGTTLAEAGPFRQINEGAGKLASRMTVVAQQHLQQRPQSQIATTQIVYGIVQANGAQPAPAPQPIPQPVPAPAPQPAPVPQPAPAPVPQPVPAPVPAPQPLPVPGAYPIPSTQSAFGLTLGVTKQGTSFVPGEKLEVVVTSERKCSLVLLDVYQDGSYNILFPNAVDKEVWLTAGKAEFLAGGGRKTVITAGQAGTHTLLALCSANRTFAQWLWGKTEYRADATGRSQVVVKQPTLAEVMNNRPKGDEANATFVYTVTGN